MSHPDRTTILPNCDGKFPGRYPVITDRIRKGERAGTIWETPPRGGSIYDGFYGVRWDGASTAAPLEPVRLLDCDDIVASGESYRPVLKLVRGGSP